MITQNFSSKSPHTSLQNSHTTVAIYTFLCYLLWHYYGTEETDHESQAPTPDGRPSNLNQDLDIAEHHLSKLHVC